MIRSLVLTLIGLFALTAAQPVGDPSGLKPLTELGAGEYKGFKGGLYPDGKNERPAAHEAAGRNLAGQVQPLDDAGKPSPRRRRRWASRRSSREIARSTRACCS